MGSASVMSAASHLSAGATLTSDLSTLLITVAENVAVERFRTYSRLRCAIRSAKDFCLVESDCRKWGSVNGSASDWLCAAGVS